MLKSLAGVAAASGTIRSSGGTLGTLFVNGAARQVEIPPFYVGNPAGC